jgi:5-methylcytosine-specific restriction endonuclease McrA
MSKIMSPALRSRLRKHNVEVIDRKVTLESIYKEHKGKCQECGRHTVMRIHPQVNHSAPMEHKTPISMGGHHTRENVTLLCYSCNNTKNTKMLKAPARKFRFLGYEISIKKVGV